MTDQATAGKPVVLLRPAPQITSRIFTDDALRRLHERYTVIDGEADPSEAAIEACLPDVFAIIGQPDLPRERLERAPRLRAVLNVEGNFFPNVDYDACFERGVNVVACMPTYAQAVAEFSLGLAIDLAALYVLAIDRNISHSVTRHPIGLGRSGGDGQRPGILVRGAGGHEGAERQVFDFV